VSHKSRLQVGNYAYWRNCRRCSKFGPLLTSKQERMQSAKLQCIMKNMKRNFERFRALCVFRGDQVLQGVDKFESLSPPGYQVQKV